jgi:hypothetical protein
MTRRLIWLAALALGCAEEQPPMRVCAVGSTLPEFVSHLSCHNDYAQLGSEEDVFGTFSHTRTVNVLIDRQDQGQDRVYFLNTKSFWLHFDFAYFVVEGHPRSAYGTPEYYAAHAQFNLLNYQSTQRRYVLGKIVQYLDQDRLVYELAAGDNADATLIAWAFGRVREELFNGEGLVYRPVSNGQEGLVPELEGKIPLLSTAELFAGQSFQPLNQGTSYGYLRFRKLAQLEGQRAKPVDIVVLDRVPNDLSVVAGIVTAELQTPLSHINVLSKNRGTPNMALVGAWTDETLRAKEDQLVKLVVTPHEWAIETASLDAAQLYWDLRRPKEPLVPRHDLSVTDFVDLSLASAASITSVGAKAANFAELLHLKPPVTTLEVRVPSPAFAIPFSAFDRHMTQHGLWEKLDAIQDSRGEDLERGLFRLRWELYNAPMDPALLASLVELVLARYGETKLRFRSSTNVEDLAEFSGAGLYTSVGASLKEGPTAIEKAVKVVWASAFGYGAFVERDFYRVDHRQVMMGVLMHAAFPDELANGVALTMNQFTELRPAFYINSQKGDVSVANPTGEATPEQILWYTYLEDQPRNYQVLTRSSLTGGEPVLADAEYAELASFLNVVHAHFRKLHCQRDPSCAIDVEFKLAPDHRVYVKQARPLKSAP